MIIMTQDIFCDEEKVFKECFIKLKTPAEKPIYPKTYLKIINKLGLTIEYDLMVLEEILFNTKAKDGEIYALNISPTSLRNEKFLVKTKELIRESSIKIMFVLNESEYFSHTSRFNGIINSLKSVGVLIAVSRLGSIHSSFLYLRELDIDIVRFDTYYSNESKIKQNLSIISGFNLMAHDKNIKTWIKNIENEETLSLVKQVSIDYMQGKQFSSLEKIYEN